jgi:hypothetical protein
MPRRLLLLLLQVPCLSSQFRCCCRHRRQVASAAPRARRAPHRQQQARPAGAICARLPAIWLQIHNMPRMQQQARDNRRPAGLQAEQLQRQVGRAEWQLGTAKQEAAFSNVSAASITCHVFRPMPLPPHLLPGILPRLWPPEPH